MPDDRDKGSALPRRDRPGGGIQIMAWGMVIVIIQYNKTGGKAQLPKCEGGAAAVVGVNFRPSSIQIFP